MTDITKRAEEKYPITRDSTCNGKAQTGYIQGWKDCLEEYGEEIKSMNQKLGNRIKNAESWELLIGRIKDQIEQTGSTATAEMVYALWRDINDEIATTKMKL